MSFIISAFLHLLLLAVLLINYSFSQKPLASTHQPVAVDILVPSDISRTKAGEMDKADSNAAPKTITAEKKADPLPADEQSMTKPEPTPEKISKKQALLPPPPKPKAPPLETAPKVVEAPAPKPIKPKVEKVAAPKSESKPVPPKSVKVPTPKRVVRKDPTPSTPPPEEEPDEELQEPSPQEKQLHRETPQDVHHVERQRDDTPRFTERNTKEERKRFDANRIAALLNKDPNAGQQQRNPGPPQPWRRPSTLQDQANGFMSNAPERTSYGIPSGHDDRMSANEIDAFIAQISRCWAPPIGGLGSDAIVVKLHIELNENGMLARPPKVANNDSSPFFMPAADSAVRAVLQCQPYRMPPEKFAQWRDLMLNFDPREMYGG